MISNTFFCVILLIIVVCTIIIGCYNDNASSTIMFNLTLLAIGVGILTLKLDNEITPMDVYQGKTTLEYTIRDGQIIDSVIVWKDKKGE